MTFADSDLVYGKGGKTSFVVRVRKGRAILLWLENTSVHLRLGAWGGGDLLGSAKLSSLLDFGHRDHLGFAEQRIGLIRPAFFANSSHF